VFGGSEAVYHCRGEIQEGGEGMDRCRKAVDEGIEEVEVSKIKNEKDFYDETK